MRMTVHQALLAVLLLAAVPGPPLLAQWLNHRDPTIPRTADGKPDLSARTPRASDGKPDLSGVWRVEPTPEEELTRLFGDLAPLSVPGDDARTFSKYLFNILADFKAEEEPIRPEALEIFKQRAPGAGKDFPTGHCLPAGVPNGLLIPIPFKIIQTPRLTAVLFEGDNTIRQIYTDGRTPPPDPQPLWLGYSVGKWDGDERFRRRDVGHLDVQATIDDPAMYTRAFTIKYTLLLQPDTDILELFCAENEKDRAHLIAQ
jgi:hypothetical protein